MESLNPGLIRRTPHLVSLLPVSWRRIRIILRDPLSLIKNNVEKFLMGCKDLGMSKEQLFEEADLWDPSRADQSRLVGLILSTVYRLPLVF